MRITKKLIVVGILCTVPTVGGCGSTNTPATQGNTILDAADFVERALDARMSVGVVPTNEQGPWPEDPQTTSARAAHDLDVLRNYFDGRPLDEASRAVNAGGDYGTIGIRFPDGGSRILSVDTVERSDTDATVIGLEEDWLTTEVFQNGVWSSVPTYSQSNFTATVNRIPGVGWRVVSYVATRTPKYPH